MTPPPLPKPVGDSLNLTGASLPKSQADKTLQGAGSGFSFFGGREDKYQNAADLYVQAANAFKMQKQGQHRPIRFARPAALKLTVAPAYIDLEAGKAFEKAAEVFTKNLNEPDDAANSLIDAFKAYRKTDAQSAVRCVKVAIQRYCAKGNFRRAAGQQEALAEVYEQELGDTKSALEALESAASWYEGDNANA